MKYSFYFAVFLCLFSSLALAETSVDTKSAANPMMEAFLKASTPGAEHKLLEDYVGRWGHEVKWWSTPDTEPQVSKGTTEVESIFGGRFIRQQASGTSMNMPFQGLGITGFDNVQQSFSTVWLDNMGTGIMVGSGKFDKSINAIVDRGVYSCPLSASGKRSYRAVWTLPKNNSYKYELFSAGDDGKEFRMMEIVYNKVQ